LEGETGKGISMTISARSLFVDGSIHSILVPGEYFSSKVELSSQSNEQKRPPLDLSVG
jgi:hypothetical protein